MAFDRLQALGEVKFTKILNALLRGTPAGQLARTIRTEWGDFGDTAEKTLTQQLLRLRIAAAQGIYGKAIAAKMVDGASPVIKALTGISVSALDRMEELAAIQRQRVLDFVARERSIILPPPKYAPKPKPDTLVVPPPVLTGPVVVACNQIFNDYKELLKDIQKMRFDVGADEFKGVIPGMARMRGASEQTTHPDGTNVQRQVFEAVTTLEDIFARRQVPALTSLP